MSGSDLRQLRKRLGLSQQDLAYRLGIRDRSHVANVERGHERMSRPRLRLLHLIIEMSTAA